MTEISRGAIEAGAEALAESMYNRADPLIHPDEWQTLEKYTQAVLSAALPKLMPERFQLNPEEQAAADADLHMSTCYLGQGDCLQCTEEAKSIHRHWNVMAPLIEERVQRDLAEAGRLLPPVGEGRTYWRVSDMNSGGAIGYSSEEEAREDLDQVRDKPQTYALERRWVNYYAADQPIVEVLGPWEVVETVGGAVEQDHGSFVLTDEAQESGEEDQ